MRGMGLSKSSGSDASDCMDTDRPIKRDPIQTMWNLLVQEARSVSLWSFLSIGLRFGLIRLGMLVEFQRDPTSQTLRESGLDVVSKELWTTASVLGGWILGLAPSKVPNLQAQGFIFANPWLLLWVRNKTGVVPNVPTRACEYVMGRISLLELLAILPIHVIAMVSTSVFLRQVLPVSITEVALDSIEYSDGENPWIVDLCREVLASAGFTVALLVVPVFFQLNHMPRWLSAFVMYPLMNFSVDARGMGSTFAPNVLLALSVLGHRSLPSGWRLIGPLLGGLVGGRVMEVYFPDSERTESN